jgi:hypothetical protein
MSGPERLAAIISLLNDEHEADRVLDHVLADPDLLRQVYLHACRQGCVPERLGRAVLERHAAGLIERFAAIGTLEEGLWVLPRLQHILLDHTTTGPRRLDRLVTALQATTDPGDLGRRLLRDYGFATRSDGDHGPDDSFLPSVLTTRIGRPLVLACLWRLLATRLGHAVGILILPGRVWCAWNDVAIELAEPDRRWANAELQAIAVQTDANHPGRLIRPATDHRILQRICLDLAVTYRHRQDLLRCHLAVIMGRSLG